MSRIKPVVQPSHDAVRRNFEAIEKQLGVVPNMMRTMAQAPRVLEGYLALSRALGRGLLPGALQEQIALAVAERNGCDYCLSAHTALGRRAGLSEGELAASRAGVAADAKSNAALQFALSVLQHRGGVSDDDLARVRAAGFSDAEITEIIAHVSLNVLTNYFNRAADTEIDFPRVIAAEPV
jgi:uncharacterized peroxidase-related enzyme